MNVSSRMLAQALQHECQSVREFGYGIPTLIAGDRACASVMGVCDTEQSDDLGLFTLSLRSQGQYRRGPIPRRILSAPPSLSSASIPSNERTTMTKTIVIFAVSLIVASPLFGQKKEDERLSKAPPLCRRSLARTMDCPRASSIRRIASWFSRV